MAADSCCFEESTPMKMSTFGFASVLPLAGVRHGQAPVQK
jgi:hypothetical protein